MNLIDRYLHEVGRYLTGKNREDILAEIRSHIMDTLDARVQGEPQEEDILALLKEMGSPQKLAASYRGGRQYLIGPELYPFFRMVAWIALAGVIGAQLLAFVVNIWLHEEPAYLWQTMLSMFASIPSTLGSVVIVFMILQYFGVTPKVEDETWDPKNLPVIEAQEKIDRGGRIFGIAAGSVILTILLLIPEKIGIYVSPGGPFYPDPVIAQYSGWICLSILAGIALDIYLLWQGRWTAASRVAKIAVNLLGIIVLTILLQGHNAWLAAHGSTGFFVTLEHLETAFVENMQVFGIEMFRLAFFIALIVITIETIRLLVKLVRGAFVKNTVGLL